jgi:hypothetical protein
VTILEVILMEKAMMVHSQLVMMVRMMVHSQLVMIVRMMVHSQLVMMVRMMLERVKAKAKQNPNPRPILRQNPLQLILTMIYWNLWFHQSFWILWIFMCTILPRGTVAVAVVVQEVVQDRTQSARLVAKTAAGPIVKIFITL